MEDERNIQDIPSTPPTPPDFSNVIADINYNLPDNNTQAITAKKLRDTLTYTMSNVSTAIYVKDNDRIIDSLGSSDANRALSAKQGNVLNNSIGTIQTTLSGLVVDNLVSTATDKALSANMGRVLDNGITVLNNSYNTLNTTVGGIQTSLNGLVINNLNSTYTDKALSAYQGNVVNTKVEAIQMYSNDNFSYGDLGFSDEDGNVLVQFSYGHIKTAYFDSSNIETGLPLYDYSYADYGIVDELGYVLVKFSDGHIKTKYFDSSNITPISPTGDSSIVKFVNKKISILGDSLSSFSGQMPSDLPNYPGTTNYIPHYPHGTVTAFSDTWMYKMCVKLGMDPFTQLNSCGYGTSTIDGDSTSTTSAFVGTSTRRIDDLSFKFGSAPDIVLTFMGANDYGNYPIGNWTYTDGIPAEGTIGEFKKAYALMVAKIMTAYPLARVFCITLCDFKGSWGGTTWPTRKNNIYTQQYNEAITDVANVFGCGLIDFHACGLNFFSENSVYSEDGVHPTAAGMDLWANYAAQQLINQY